MWFNTAAASAGLELPLVYMAQECLHRKTLPPPGPIFEQVERLAKRKHPLSMIVQAMVLGRLGKFDEGISMIEQVMEDIYPTKNPNPIHEDDFVIDDAWLVEKPWTPWQVYAWLKESVGDQAATDKIIEKAAMEYQDVQCLKQFAQIKMLQGNLELYEECMNKASMAGDMEASRKLANFYYLTFVDRYPIRGEKTVAATMFGRIRRRSEYRTMALNWYSLVSLSGDPKACLMVSVLSREDAEIVGRNLDFARSDEKLRPLVQDLEANWHDPSYEPRIPVRLLDV